MKSYLYLLIAIIAEIIATSALHASAQFTRWVPSTLSILFYIVAFYALSLSLKGLNLGVAYAIWSGVGLVIITMVAWVFFNQKLDTPAILGIGLILMGSVIINLFSNTSMH